MPGSGVGATIQENAVPVATLNRHEVELRHALHGGDEYQLLFTVPPGRRVPAVHKGTPLTLIGYITAEPEICLEHENGYTTELEPEGWEHFARAGAERAIIRIIGTKRNFFSRMKKRPQSSGRFCCSVGRKTIS